MVDKDKPDSKRGERDDPSPPLLGADIARIALSLVLPVLSAVFLGLSFLPSPRRGPFFRPTSLGASSADLTFGPVNFAGHSNWVYRDGATAAQVVLSSASSSTDPVRFITAFPHGNTGTLAYLHPVGSDLGATVAPGSLVSVAGKHNQTGISGLLEVSGDFDFGVTIIGSVRAIRDYVEGGGVLHPEFRHSLANHSPRRVTLERRWLDNSTVQYIQFDAEDNAALHVSPDWPPAISVVRPDPARNATLRFTAVFNFTSAEAPRGLGPDELFATPNEPELPVLVSVLDAIKHKAHNVTQQLAFLAYDSVFLAGGWRFLTYFGRDSLIMLKLLLPVLSPEATESILASVIQRIGPNGEICHEETVGDYAAFLNIRNGTPELGSTPVYDYSMSDTDFLLMPVLSDYFQTQAGRRRMEAFLARNSTLVPGSFDELVNRNREHIVNLTTDFPYSVHGRIGDLVGSRAYPIGNWRDSLAGLGWGNYPFDLNCGPAAPLLHWPQPRDGNLKEGYPYVPFPGPSHLGNKPRGARRLFEVTITPEETEASLARYVDRANLSSSLLYGAGALNSTFTLSEGWNSPNQTIGRNGNSTFYALSIDAKEWVEDGRRIISSVNVLNSDLSFVLAYDTVASSPNQIRATVEAMQPYPRGLLTNVGMVVANAAYDPNTTNIDVFSNRAYHGAVAWSWQQALMAAGLSKQLASCSSWGPAREGESSWFNQQFCQDSALVESLKQAETRLWDSIAGSESVLYTEVWSPVFNATTNKFDIGDLGAISPEGTEGNAFQLWSYAFLGLVDPRTGRPVAAGFVPPSAL